MLIRILILTLFLATGCTPSPVQQPTPTPDRLPGPKEVFPDPTATLLPADAGLQKKFILLVSKDLATRLHLSVEAIALVSVEALEWPNAALGCPSPGKVYAQGTVPGFRIRLMADNQEYSYHTDRKGQFVLCANPDAGIQDPVVPVTPAN